MIAVYPGSFDPPTVGHIEIMRRAAKLCDVLYVLVLVNPNKRQTFAPESRKAMLEKSLTGIDGVNVMASDRPLIELYNELGADSIVRGLRCEQDYSAERPVADAFLELMGAETIFIQSSPGLAYISSSLVREMMSLSLPVSELLPPEIINDVSSERS